AGGSHNCARRPGAVACWGEDATGQLGNGAAGGGGTPSTVTGVTDAVTLDASRWHTCFVSATQTASCCGLNDHGQLGDGTNAGSRPSPVAVQGLVDASTAGAGEYFTCFLRQNGAVACTGDNTYGQL